MKAYYLEQFNSIDGIVCRDRPIPAPGPHEVLVRVKAVSLNRRDIAIVHQKYALQPKAGIIPVSDGAGEIVRCGSAVRRFQPGQGVMGNYFPRWRDGQMQMDIIDQLGCTLDGMLAEYVILPEDALVAIPAGMDYEAAATLPCAALTAWSALTAPYPAAPGSTVLTFGSGGIASFEIQFAKLFGARVIALTTRASSEAALRALGADEVVQYNANDAWSQQVLHLTGGRGVDRVLETGGAETFAQSLQAVTVGGVISLLNFRYLQAPAAPTALDQLLLAMFAKRVTVHPIFVGSRLTFENMCRALAAHPVQPSIERVFAFEEAKEAYRYFEAGGHRGKIVIRVDGE
ncbi:alcohol dehydrogenase [Chitinophaga parva]|uniref:Alcohol dehydrogenase n=1 Tax=Chitinophaga parva TaxID=2169414 RepID=A0A2T7BJW6_9BACT|nr:NAD(P)-dependent alcohol dehydrogenase [Chitinophaga parva]PUZ27967.1 alcohol dehydrogenase [Chitinophaga parva]